MKCDGTRHYWRALKSHETKKNRVLLHKRLEANTVHQQEYWNSFFSLDLIFFLFFFF